MAAGDEETAVDPQQPARGTGELPPGTLLNGIYRIEARLGVGGMGEVYRATNLANDEQDAIKIIGRARADQAQIEAMFRKEARVLSRIRSPAVAQLKLFARDPDLNLLYFITDFVPGESLLDRLRRQPATPGELRALLRRVLTGLQAVHEAGAVHRDLSPDNIILPGGDPAQAKIIDFGIAKELDPARTTMIGDSFAGKLGYIAPEQLGFSGSEVGPWTDLYSLALVAIAFAAGRPLDMGATVGRAEEARRGEIDLTALPDDLRPVFARLLTYDWRARPRSAAEVLAALAGAGAVPVAVMAPPVAPTAVPVQRAAFVPPPPRAPSATPVLMGIVALIVLLVASAVAIAVYRPHVPASPAGRDAAVAPAAVPTVARRVTPTTLPPPGVATGAGRCGPAITVAFGPSLAAITSGAEPLISGAMDRVRMCDPIFVNVTGKASTREVDPFGLAQRRADAIAGALRAAGVPAIRLQTKVWVASPDPKKPAETYRLEVVEIDFVDP